MWNKPIVDERVNQAIREGVASQAVARSEKNGGWKASGFARLLRFLRRFRPNHDPGPAAQDSAWQPASSSRGEAESV